MRFLVDISRTKMPLRFRKRVAFRNSKVRESVSGFANYERVWFGGCCLVLEWGSFDAKKPDHAKAGRQRTAT